MGINQGMRYRIVAWLGVLAISMAPYCLVLAFGVSSTGWLPFAVAWQLAGLALGSIFLSPLGILLLIGINSAAILGFGILLPGERNGWVFSSLAIYLPTSFIILGSVYHRHRQESLRKKDLEEKDLELESMRNLLDVNVDRNSSDLERQINQLKTAAELSTSVSSALEQGPDLQQVTESFKKGFGLYYVGIFLLDESRSFAVLEAGTGEEGRRMVAEGHRLAVGGASMVGWALLHKKPRIALDVGLEAVHFENPHLPETRSEIALPLIAGEELLGALSIQSSEPLAFDEEDLAAVEGIATSLAEAVHRVRLFKRVQESLSEIQSLHSGHLTKVWSEMRTSDFGYEYRREGAADWDHTGDLSTFAIPLTLREQVIAEVTVEAEKSEWSPEEQDLIEAITNQAAVAMENARLLDETRRRVEQERIVTDIVGKLYGTADVNHILRTGLQELSLALNAAEGTIVFGEDTESLQG
jgi:GAF domain-containing protein